MHIQEILPGKIIKVELAEEKKTYEINAKVMGTNPNGLFIPCISYKGEPLDPQIFTRRGFTINVYCGDHGGSEWIGWANVNMEVGTFGGKNAYRIWTSNFNSLSRPADRREHERITLDVLGTMTTPAIPGTFSVTIKDISDNGLAFVTRQVLDIVQSPVQIRFSEKVQGKDHDLVIDCKCVRTQKLPNGFLYGCMVSKSNRDVLAFVYLKKILARKEERDKAKIEMEESIS